MYLRSLFASAAILACLAFASQGAELRKADNTVAFGGAEYRLGPEDVIEVFVWKEPELSTTVMVRPDGKISLPLIGELEASGKTGVELQEEVSRKLRQYVSDPIVNVMVKQINSPKISVLGEVRKPDVYKIKHKITVLDAIALAGGFTEFAKRDKVIVIRNGSSGRERIKVNLKQLIKQDSKDEMFYLQPFDTVYVE